VALTGNAHRIGQLAARLEKLNAAS